MDPDLPDLTIADVVISVAGRDAGKLFYVLEADDVYLTLDKDLQMTAYNLLEEKLAGIILRKLSPVLDYKRNPEGSATDVVVPIGDVYYSFIGNEILDIDAFGHEKASPTERAVYASFNARQERAIGNIISNLESATSPAYKNGARAWYGKEKL